MIVKALRTDGNHRVSGSSFAWIEIALPPEHARGKAVVIDPCLPFGRAVQHTAQGTQKE
jgi:hypothetical protein